MPIQQIPETEWGEVAAPIDLAVLPLYPDEFAQKYGIHFFEFDDDGLGVALGAFVKIANTPYFLTAHPQGPTEAHYVEVSSRSYERNTAKALEIFLAETGITESELRWRGNNLGEATWILYRMDDYGNEAEMFRFHHEHLAEWVRKRYEAKGHKQVYSLRNITSTKSL